MTEEELRAICKGCRERYPNWNCWGCPNYADVELVRHEQSQADRIAELQAYRATGLTVERAAELGKADREGRVLVLPCQEGSNIYVIYPHVNAESEIEKRYFSLIYFSLNDFGKRWFLTREEAEKALEAEQDG